MVSTNVVSRQAQKLFFLLTQSPRNSLFPEQTVEPWKTAIQNVRLAAQIDSFGMKFQQANDEHDDDSQFILPSTSPKLTQEDIDDERNYFQNEPEILFEPDYSTEPSSNSNVDDSMYVYWPLMNSFYNDRVHKINNNKHVIPYDYKSVET